MPGGRADSGLAAAAPSGRKDERRVLHDIPSQFPVAEHRTGHRLQPRLVPFEQQRERLRPALSGPAHERRVVHSDDPSPRRCFAAHNRVARSGLRVTGRRDLCSIGITVMLVVGDTGSAAHISLVLRLDRR
jgi:hypothetical protein